MPYADEISIDIGGVQKLLYAPDSILADIDGSTATLPDESGSSNDGVITWGGNPANTLLAIAGLTSDYTVTSITPTGTVDFVPDINLPTSLSDVARLAYLAANDGLFYPFFYDMNTVSGISILIFYWVFFMLLAIVAFMILMKFTGKAIIASIGAIGVLGFAVGYGVFDWWIILLIGGIVGAIAIKVDIS